MRLTVKSDSVLPDGISTIGLRDIESWKLSKWEQIVPKVFPTNESQVRPLTQLPTEEQVEAWQQAVAQNQGKVPPARIVKDVVQRIRERHPVPNPYRVGDVCAIIVKDNPDLRGYGGAWGIISEVHQFSCTVQLWNGVKPIRLEHLKELVYSPQQKTDLQQLANRLNQLPLDSLEPAIKAFLAGLGKLNRTGLTRNEEGMLAFLEESHYCATL